jgi:hypothetical protein
MRIIWFYLSPLLCSFQQIRLTTVFPQDNMDQQLKELKSDIACLQRHKEVHEHSCAYGSNLSESNQMDKSSVSKTTLSESSSSPESVSGRESRDCTTEHRAGMVSACDWQQQMTDALEKALGSRLDSLAMAIVQPLQSELRQLVTVMMDQLQPEGKNTAHGHTTRNAGISPPRASPAYKMPSPRPLDQAEMAEQGGEGTICCSSGGVQEAAVGNPTSRGRRRRMALAAGHSVILTDRFQRHAATPASVPRSPAAEDKADVDHLSAAVAVMAEASAVSLTAGSGWPRRISSPPSTKEQNGAIYCGGGIGAGSGANHLISSKFFSSPVVEKRATEPPVDRCPDNLLLPAESCPSHPLSILSPAAAEAAFAFGVALAREEGLQWQSSSDRKDRQSMNQAAAIDKSSSQSSGKPLGDLRAVSSSRRGGRRRVPSPQDMSPTGEIGWMQSAISSGTNQMAARRV